MNKSSMVKSLFGAAFGLALVTSMGASAESYSETTVVGTNPQGLPTVSIAYADLNLTKSEGVQTLHNRISRAARQVCGSSNWRDTASVRIANQNKACYKDAVAEGLKQIEYAQVAVAQ